MAAKKKAAAKRETVAQSRDFSDGIMVKATRTGHYNNRRFREGDIFTITGPEEFGATWMVVSDEDGREDLDATLKLTKALKAEKRSAVAERLEEAKLDAGQAIDQPDMVAFSQAHVHAANSRRQFTDQPRKSERVLAVRGDTTNPDTGTAPSVGEGTNVNPGPYPAGDQTGRASDKSVA